MTNRHAVLSVSFLLSAFFVAGSALLPAVAQAVLTETPVPCQEGVIREPILLQYGEHTEGCQLDYVTDQDQFNFYGQTGDEVAIAVGWTTDSIQKSLLITLSDPNGSEIIKESTIIVLSRGQYWRKEIQLTETGLHYIFIEETEHDATAGYQLAIQGIPPMVSTPRLTNASPLEGVIEGPADIDLFIFQGTEGSRLQIPVSFTSENLNKTMHVQIRDPGGILIVDQESVLKLSRGQNMLIELLLTKGGRYYLTIDGKGTTFGYQVVLQCVAGACPNLQPQPSVEGCLREKGQPLAGVKVKLEQAGEPKRYKVTDSRGCYNFPAVVPDLEYRVSVVGSVE